MRNLPIQEIHAYSVIVATEGLVRSLSYHVKCPDALSHNVTSRVFVVYTLDAFQVQQVATANILIKCILQLYQMVRLSG
jgi:hypothetical protein